MSADFEDAFIRVKELAAEFKANEKYFLSPQYQEAEARRDFIDKFLTALGWDMSHDRQKNPYEQEVKVERKEHGTSQRRADYAFYIGPNFRDVKFYIEAKKPHGDIATADNGEMRRYSLDLGFETYEDYTKEIELSKPVRFFSGPRLLLRQLVSRKFRLQAVFTSDKFLTNQSVQSLVPRDPSCRRSA